MQLETSPRGLALHWLIANLAALRCLISVIVCDHRAFVSLGWRISTDWLWVCWMTEPEKEHTIRLSCTLHLLLYSSVQITNQVLCRNMFVCETYPRRRSSPGETDVMALNDLPLYVANKWWAISAFICVKRLLRTEEGVCTLFIACAWQMLLRINNRAITKNGYTRSGFFQERVLSKTK